MLKICGQFVGNDGVRLFKELLNYVAIECY